MRSLRIALASLLLATGALTAQAVPEGSPAAKVDRGYRRTPTFRLDPFRHAMIPHWGFVFSAGASVENNTLSFADVRALLYLKCGPVGNFGFADLCDGPDSLLTGDMLDALGLIPEGSGLKVSGGGEGGFYLGGPLGGHLSLGLSLQGRGYGAGHLDDSFVSLARDGNGALQDFSLGDSRGAALATAEIGAHTVLRFSSLGSEDGPDLSLGFGGRYIRPIYLVRAFSTLANGGAIRVTGDTIAASVGVRIEQTDSAINPTSGKGSIAGDFLVRLSWPTSGFALEAMVANLGKVTVTGVGIRSDTLQIATTTITDVGDALDSFNLDSAKITQDVQITLPRIVRFTASAWANRFLQLDVSATMPVTGDFASPLAVDVGTTWRLIRTIPLRAGVVLGGNQGIGFTSSLAIEGRNMFFQVMGQSLGGLFGNATGVGARLELGTFF
ncbi:MAG TPA: hypothetical protein VJL31_08500 [Gemmatimonadales bacterium]|nr:hypothetical protein [Gemmatimonadales bacterium]